jgi:hypothetical protein
MVAFGRTQPGGRDAGSRDVVWHALDPKAWKRAAGPDGLEAWTTLLERKPLAEGKNTFELRVANSDGPAATELVEVTGKRPAPTPPEILLVGRPPSPVSEPHCRLAFRVRSCSRPPSVNLWHNGREVDEGVLGKPEEDDGDYLYQIARLTLDEGPNDFRLIASNDGGSSDPALLNVSYVPPTAQVHLDGYTADGKDLGLEEAAQSGRVILRGRVEWPRDDDPALRVALRLRAWVNDFEQADVELDRPEPGERQRHFKVALVLNREDNHVELRFPQGVKLAEGQDPRRCTLSCRKPVPEQRLHLLIVAPEVRGDDELAALRDKLLEALGATDRAGTRFRTRAFARPSTYYAIPCWEETAPSVFAYLRAIRNAITRPSAGDFSDVVLVYFKGRTVVKGDKTYLLWTHGETGAAEIDPDQIRRALSDIRGAKLLLLDVAGAPGSARGPAFDRVGDLQYIWLGSAEDDDRDSLIDHLTQLLARDGRWRAVRQLVREEAERRKEKVIVRSPERPPGYEDLFLRKKGE